MMKAHIQKFFAQLFFKKAAEGSGRAAPKKKFEFKRVNHSNNNSVRSTKT